MWGCLAHRWAGHVCAHNADCTSCCNSQLPSLKCYFHCTYVGNSARQSPQGVRDDMLQNLCRTSSSHMLDSAQCKGQPGPTITVSNTHSPARNKFTAAANLLVFSKSCKHNTKQHHTLPPTTQPTFAVGTALTISVSHMVGSHQHHNKTNFGVDLCQQSRRGHIAGHLNTSSSSNKAMTQATTWLKTISPELLHQWQRRRHPHPQHLPGRLQWHHPQHHPALCPPAAEAAAAHTRCW